MRKQDFSFTLCWTIVNQVKKHQLCLAPTTCQLERNQFNYKK